MDFLLIWLVFKFSNAFNIIECFLYFRVPLAPPRLSFVVVVTFAHADEAIIDKLMEIVGHASCLSLSGGDGTCSKIVFFL